MAGAPRHLQGCYVDHDAVRSRVDWAAYAAAEGGEECGRAFSQRFDVHMCVTEKVMAALATQAGFTYGEGLSMLEHALQAAHCAMSAGAAVPVVLACLMHDVGNTIAARDVWHGLTDESPPLLHSPKGEQIGYAKHADMGGTYLRAMGFADAVSNAVALHVRAKRALVTMEPSYFDELSQASIDTLKHQGGPLNTTELDAFNGEAGATVALQLRRYDDLAKEPSKDGVPRLDAYKQTIYDHLCARSAAAVAPRK
jgi:predicted HD phosphohydrolase